MSVVHETQRMIGISKVPQANFATQTPILDPTDFVRLEVTDKDFAKLTPEVSDNEGDAHGFENATDQYLHSWDTQASHGLAVSAEQIGRLLLLAFGGVVTSQPAAVPSPTVYQHVFTPMDISATRQLPATTMIEVMGTSLNRMHPSMCLETLSLKGDGMKRIDSQFSFKGSGRETLPSGLSVAEMKANLLTGLHYFFNSQATVRIADTVTLANAVNYGAARRHNGWSFDWNNQFLAEEGYYPGGGLWQTAGNAETGAIRTELLLGRRMANASLNVRFNAQSEEEAALKSRAKLDWTVVLTGALIEDAFFNSLTIEAHQLQYESVELSSANGIIESQIKPKIEVDPATGSWITATLINNVPSYTV